ncbi:TPA: hypothetical protein OT801_000368 [Morganella morganii]|uniref:hypothetical protein n=1 Tax=Morganella morganii TaxID=582 RepID=UPI000B3F6A8D|nr:hypothetical protein [Morganella morganii]EJG2201697.1 hypothetical protein [Morganella morganii]MBT0312475.1 hypothetical protein [Morganella morganii subsp. morganii]OVF51623.1 hypothetical protein B5724_17715 [Morganella morganii]HBU8229636.1 hypothetical protein [Morganella morganii]HCT7706377.1 hypothetical protein [Morganella morganii]
MSRYKVLKKSFINGRLLYPGEEIEFIGVAGSNLQLIETADRRTANEDANTGNDNHNGDNGGGEGGTGSSGSDGGADNELIALQDQYQQLFGKKPHHNAGAEKLRADIDAKRKELGV